MRKFEPLLLVTIGFGGILSNIPGVEIATGDGLLHMVYVVGIETGTFPLIIFMGVGAMTDFGPLLANPRTLFLGAAACSIFATLLGAVALSATGVLEFDLKQSAAIGIIGGADGPTTFLSPVNWRGTAGGNCHCSYSYGLKCPYSAAYYASMTTQAEREITMVQLRSIKAEKVVFPLLLLLLVLLLPSAAPLQVCSALAI